MTTGGSTATLDTTASSGNLFKAKPKSRFPHLHNKKRLSQGQKRKGNSVMSDNEERDDDDATLSPTTRPLDDVEDQEKELRSIAMASPRTRGFSFFAPPPPSPSPRTKSPILARTRHHPRTCPCLCESFTLPPSLPLQICLLHLVAHFSSSLPLDWPPLSLCLYAAFVYSFLPHVYFTLTLSLLSLSLLLSPFVFLAIS